MEKNYCNRILKKKQKYQSKKIIQIKAGEDDPNTHFNIPLLYRLLADRYTMESHT